MVGAEVGAEKLHLGADGQINHRHPDTGDKGTHSLQETLVGVSIFYELTGGKVKVVRVDRTVKADLPVDATA